MTWWDDRAAALQKSVAAFEAEISLPEDAEARQNIKFLRQDLVSALSQLSSANSQLWAIKALLIVVVVLLGVIAYRVNT